ncbi:dihydrofolate reductase family protein [Brachybacterium hainanense]|uniref:Dihydrofolate reductase family protein n=1 Tax=Brachybacterium hainanense TaxID=1541174 RepID=A0ABV6R7Q0_9MICO
MSQVVVHNFSISLDGYGTGEGLTQQEPFGHAGERLHTWMFATRMWARMTGDPDPSAGSTGIDDLLASRHERGVGAEIMGRGKWSWRSGPVTDVGTDGEWRGWWGEDPPFHTPVFVLTHHPRPPLEMEGGTTFHFLDASPAQALEIAKEAAGGLDVRIGGGPSIVRDFLAAGLIDTAHLVQVPILLGRGVNLWTGLEGLEEHYAIEAIPSPSGVVHLLLSRRGSAS